MELNLSRFAPSLSGELHLGNLASLLYNLRLNQKARWIWRVDGDINRLNFPLLRRQLSILKWLPRDQRPLAIKLLFNDDIHETLELLKKKGMIYPSQEKANIGTWKLDIFRLNGAYDFSWKEQDGKIYRLNLSNLKDPIVIKSNGKPLYSLSSCIWDYNNGIRTVIRGCDLINSSVFQILVHRFLKNEKIAFFHHPLIFFEGKKLSKRDDRFKLLDFIEKGYGLEVILKWLESHSKRRQNKPLDFSNFGRSQKNLDRNFFKWIDKNLKFSSWETVRLYLKPRFRTRYFWLSWLTWRRNLKSLVELEERALNFLRLGPKSNLHSPRCIIFDQEKNTPSFSDLKYLPSMIIKRKIIGSFPSKR